VVKGLRSRNILIAVALVAFVASLFAVPTLGHPFWSEEAEEGEEFTPPCLTDNGTHYGYHHWYNGTEGSEEFTPPCIEEGGYPLHHPPWLDEEKGGVPDSAPYQHQGGGCGNLGGGGYGHRRGGWDGHGRSMGSYGRRTG
jgi:hypothetical protein